MNIQKKTAHTSPCPNYDLIIALLDIEIEMCAFYISEQDGKPEKEPCNKRSKNVHWTDQLSDLVEFAYGIVAKRSVDEAAGALLKDIIKTLEEAFNVNLSNYTHIFYAHTQSTRRSRCLSERITRRSKRENGQHG
ncbi:MAG: RteC domain-containing protein [Alistipes finegoldii]